MVPESSSRSPCWISLNSRANRRTGAKRAPAAQITIQNFPIVRHELELRARSARQVQAGARIAADQQPVADGGDLPESLPEVTMSRALGRKPASTSARAALLYNTSTAPKRSQSPSLKVNVGWARGARPARSCRRGSRDRVRRARRLRRGARRCRGLMLGSVKRTPHSGALPSHTGFGPSAKLKPSEPPERTSKRGPAQALLRRFGRLLRQRAAAKHELQLTEPQAIPVAQRVADRTGRRRSPKCRCCCPDRGRTGPGRDARLCA